MEDYLEELSNLKDITDAHERWESGMMHHPLSIVIFKALEKADWEYMNDYFCWKSGGDGDNGETLMYTLDIAIDTGLLKLGTTS